MDEPKPIPETSIPPQVSQNPETSPDDQEQFLFYNVMPKVKEKGMVAPTMAVASEKPADPKKPHAPILARYKKLITIIVIVLIAAGIGTWAAFHFFVDSYKSESILAKPGTKAPAQNTASSSPVTTTPEWQQKYFGNQTCNDASLCGDNADPDHDGLTNVEEFTLGTDPNNKDSDGDGLSDGDEVHVFNSDPLQSHTAGNPKYSDSDYIKGGYDIRTGKLQTSIVTQSIIDNMAQFGLHQPTLSTVGTTVLLNLYHFTDPSLTPSSTTPNLQNPSSASSTLDQSPEAMQSRDAQRNDAIKNIELALVKYQADHGTYPDGSFTDMVAAVKIYFKVATNPVDPINKDPFVYGYTSDKNGTDFTLSFFSETIRQIIKKHAADAQADAKLSANTQNDDQRKNDLELIQSALLLFSQANATGNQTYVFPTLAKYRAALIPKYLSSMPKDPTTNAEYAYSVSKTFDSFTLKAVLQAPPSGNTGYVCTQDDCNFY